jgi:chaperonin cofactor prefoldin
MCKPGLFSFFAFLCISVLDATVTAAEPSPLDHNPSASSAGPTVEALTAKVQQLSEQLTVMATKKGSLGAEIDAATATLAVLQTNLADLKTALAKSAAERATLDAEVKRLNVERATLSARVDELRAKIATAKDVTDQYRALDAGTIVKFNCDAKTSKPNSAGQIAVELSEPCDIDLKLVTSAVREKEALYAPGRLLIEDGERVVLETTLPDAPGHRIEPRTWYSPKAFAYGQAYDIVIEYAPTKQGRDLNLAPRGVRKVRFRLVKAKFALQLTAKVYTAWRRGDDGDDAYLIPGLAIGGAWRWASDFNNQDVLGLRLVGAVGPNLVAKTKVVTDEQGKPQVSQRRALQILVGAEVVLGRYLALGPAWIVSGSDNGTKPLVLLTYGELYPAVSP